jgi:Uma2 family endonuclease
MELRLHRFSVDEYRRMKEFGVFQGDNPIELLHGQLIIKLDYGPPYDVPLGIPPEEITPPGMLIYPQRKFTVREYRTLLDSGALPATMRTELIEGWVVEKMVRSAPHDSAIQRISESLHKRIGTQWKVRAQLAATMDDAELEPDIAVVPGPVGRFDQAHPTPRDIVLLVEVSSSSLQIDVSIKKRDYARNSVARYWIANLVERRIEVYEDPSGPTAVPDYQTSNFYQPGEQIPLTLREHAFEPVAVDELLPAM